MTPVFGETLAKTRTKYLAGLGPTSTNEETMEKLIKAGVSIMRNNFAHAQYDEYRERSAILKRLNAKLGTNVKMEADLQGQNIRVGLLPDGQVTVEAGASYVFVTNGGDKLRDGELPINDDNLHNDVKAGESITFADGALIGTITKVEGHRITVTMYNGGVLLQRKSINVPETELTASSLTEKDYRDLDFLLEVGVDIIAVSFIAGREEVDTVRRICAEKGYPNMCIIGKVERKKAIENLWAIIEASDGIMIARGDLGIELPMEEIPILQKQITALCHQQHKPVITATQIMLSMVTAIRPTRAEVSDVANAVIEGADVLMFSEETMIGAHPALVIETAAKIARRTEEYMHHQPNYFEQYGV